eukprot:TRINITY_DN24698_c0_g1_i1.p3 TRINITY_DN24698_c0_g1~~TRINITY_DN24698_c0_g1_i1.p3  ORF type:complete len:151 (+),score=20.63 TRINITY_DN24698_c0_g1_i1:35-487(+)
MAGCDKVFIYGTLMADEVTNLILQRLPHWKNASLKGYRRYGVKQQVYPGIIPSTQNTVRGQVLYNMSSRELNMLDEYESDEYFREVVQVQINGEDGLVDAFTYVWKPNLQSKLDGNNWDYENFRKRYLKDYLKDCEFWAEEIHANFSLLQ